MLKGHLAGDALDATIARFRAAGLQAVVSTNGRMPDADIEVAYEKPTAPRCAGRITAAVITKAGAARLAAVEPVPTKVPTMPPAKGPK